MIFWIGRAVIPLFLIAAGSNYMLALAQVIVPGADNALINSLDRLTLSAAAIAACVALWRQLMAERRTHLEVLAKQGEAIEKKDAVIIDVTRVVTAALTAASDSDKEMRHIVEASVRAKQDLAIAINLLRERIGTLPCTPPQMVRG